ncbi:MAG TPA: methyltransferase domain-containing protein [Planctomycetota bacterium]
MDADLLLLCAFRLWRARVPGRRVRVLVATDDARRYSPDACLRLLAPWAEWVTLAGWQELGPDGPRGPAPAADACLAAVKDPARLAALRARPPAATLIEPVVPEKGGPDDDLYSEVCHFDFEFGGWNEWDGRPSKFPGPTLQRLSATGCRELYPAFALEGLARGPRPWRVLDVGCGPVSVLRWGALVGEMTLTGLDPLLEMYALVRARHGYDALPEIRCARELAAFAEELDGLVPDGAFEIVHTQNALDHTREPERVIGLFAQKLVPGGRVILQVATREGTRQGWDQLHKTDIDLVDGALVYRHEHTAERPLLAPDSGLALARVHYHGPDWLSVILERTDDAPASRAA